MVKMQFCVECGTPSPMDARFCAKCNTLLVLTIASIEKAPRLPWTLRKKLIVIGSPVLLLALIIIAASPKPSNVAAEITVTAPHGGIFDGSCNLTPGARGIGATDAEVVDYGAAPGSGSKTALVYKLVDGKCVANANLSLFASNNYEIYVAGVLAGEVTPEDIKAGSTAKTVPLQVTHNISGTITLSDNYQNCKSSAKGPDCTIPSNASVNAKFQKASLQCYGMGSFSDFKASGTPVTITGAGTNDSVRGTLAAGIPSVSDYKTGKVLCDYNFNLKSVIYDEKGYLVKVGTHYTKPITIADLESNSWIYNFEFKG
jgi:predicted nucleic acid-binding Zn ribbon protein